MQKKIKTSSEARRSPHLVDLTLLQNTNTDSGRLSAGSKSWRKVMANPVVMPDEIETKVIEEPEQIVEAKEEPEPVSVQEIPAPIKPRRRFVFKRVVKRMFNRTFYRFCVGLGHLVVAAVSLLFAPARLIGRTMGFFRQYFEDKSIKRSQLRLERLDKYLSERPVEQVGKEREIVSAKEPEPILEEVTESKIEEEPFFELPLTRAMRLRTVMAFALVLIVLSLPLRGILMYTSAAEVESKVLNAVRQGVSNLVVAGKATAGKDMGTASQSFTEARSNFLKAREEVGTINQLLLKLASVSPNDKLRLAGNSEAILKAAEASAALGEDLTTVAGILEFKNGSSTDVGAALTEGSAVAKRAAGQARVLSQSLNQINEDLLPDEYARTFTNLRDKTAFLEGSLSDLSVLADSLSLFLGVKQDKRYLLIFQNNAEARATGGFFGSYALIDFSKGKIKNIETPGGGSYDTDAGLRDRIVAPKPLQLISPLWHFWDSNWWPDWQVSAKKMAWFYEKSGGPTVDGVLSFTPAVMEKLLAITGPIDMTQKYGVVITSENFWLETQKLAEQKQDVTKEPKKIIGDLSQKLVEELPKRLNRETTIKLIGMLENSIEEKQILVYFNNDELTSVVKRFGWGGEVKSTNWDYLSVINTNIGGGKSDRSINQIVNHKAILQPDGSIIDELQITRVHNGSPGEVFSGVRNVDWMRIYVPAGSQLLEARGFSDPGKSYFKPLDPSWQKDPMLENEDKAVADPNSGTVVYQDLGKTVFGNWSMIDPGESATMYIRYRLPFRIVKKAEPTTFLEKAEKFLGLVPDSYYPYALLTQKQPGSTATDFTSSFSILPSDKNRGKFDVAWHYPENLNTSGTGWAEQKALNTDQYRAVFLKE